MAVKQYNLTVPGDVYDMCILRGIVTYVYPNVDAASVNIPGVGIKSGVEICYHCPDTDSFDGGRAAFEVGDEVYLLNRGGTATPSSSNLTIIGFTDGLHECLGAERVVVKIEKLGFINTVMVWDPETDAYATDVINDLGNPATFPCLESEISNWLTAAQSVGHVLFSYQQVNTPTYPLYYTNCNPSATGSPCDSWFGEGVPGAGCGSCIDTFNYTCPLENYDGSSLDDTVSSTRNASCGQIWGTCYADYTNLNIATMEASTNLFSSWRLTYANGSGVVTSIRSRDVRNRNGVYHGMEDVALEPGGPGYHWEESKDETTTNTTEVVSPWGGIEDKVSGDTSITSGSYIYYTYIFSTIKPDTMVGSRWSNISDKKINLCGSFAESTIVQIFCAESYMYRSDYPCALDDHGYQIPPGACPETQTHSDVRRFWLIATCSHHEGGTDIDPTTISKNASFESCIYQMWQDFYSVNGEPVGSYLHKPTVSVSIVRR